MPPGVGGGIRYMTVGGVVGVGCIPLPVPETYPHPYERSLTERDSREPLIKRSVPTGIEFIRNRCNLDESISTLRTTRQTICFLSFFFSREDARDRCVYLYTFYTDVYSLQRERDSKSSRSHRFFLFLRRQNVTLSIIGG